MLAKTAARLADCDDIISLRAELLYQEPGMRRLSAALNALERDQHGRAYFTLSRYWPVLVSILTASPCSTKRGTWMV